MEFDHLVLGANTLAEGQEYVEDLLGVLLPRGGQHQKFGTHNAVMRFSAGGYLEIIAIDPEAMPQQQPRWFSLDEPAALAQIRTEPKLLTWVVNSGSRPIADVLPDLPTLGAGSTTNTLVDTPMQRGTLRWNMLIPQTGQQTDLLFPWVIQWPGGSHPSQAMADLHCELLSIVAYHEQPCEFSRALGQIHCERMPVIENASENAGNRQLKAHISAPGREAVFCGLLSNTTG